MALYKADKPVFRRLPRLAWMPPHPRRLEATLLQQAPAMVAPPLAQKQPRAVLPAWWPPPPPRRLQQQHKPTNKAYKMPCARVAAR